jgi:flagellar hook-basal body complex protein FliE
MISAFDAARAYAAAQQGMGLNPGLSGAAAPQGGGFDDLVKSAITDAMSASKQAENTMAAQVAGRAELVDVVTAISAAEASLETVLAVRDQVISAYQEIMRMPI